MIAGKFDTILLIFNQHIVKDSCIITPLGKDAIEYVIARITLSKCIIITANNVDSIVSILRGMNICQSIVGGISIHINSMI